MTRWDDERDVLQLACLTESRSDAEQRAMLRVAARLDHEYNRATTGNRHGPWDMDRPDPIQIGPMSYLYDEVLESRLIDEDDGEHHVTLKTVEEKRAREAGRHPLDRVDRPYDGPRWP